MGLLYLRLAVLAARCYLRSIDQHVLVEIEARRRQPKLVPSEPLILEALFCC